MKKLEKISLAVAVVILVIFAVGIYYFTRINQERFVEQPKIVQQERADTMTIHGVAAVYFFQSDEWFDDMHKKYGDDFYTVTEDAAWYMVGADEFLKSKKITIMNGNGKRYFHFIKDNGQEVNIDIQSPSYAAPTGYLLFDGEKDPKRLDLAVPKDDYNSYFNLPSTQVAPTTSSTQTPGILFPNPSSDWDTYHFQSRKYTFEIDSPAGWKVGSETDTSVNLVDPSSKKQISVFIYTYDPLNSIKDVNHITNITSFDFRGMKATKLTGESAVTGLQANWLIFGDSNTYGIVSAPPELFDHVINSLDI